MGMRTGGCEGAVRASNENGVALCDHNEDSSTVARVGWGAERDARVLSGIRGG